MNTVIGYKSAREVSSYLDTWMNKVSRSFAVVVAALEEPLRMIVENAGAEGSIVVQKVKEGKDDYGFNARTEVYENLYTSGVIDPTKVARVALENAASIAGTLLTTECVIFESKDEKEPAMPNPGMGGMGGMY